MRCEKQEEDIKKIVETGEKGHRNNKFLFKI